jgi:hypothetical protein
MFFAAISKGTAQTAITRNGVSFTGTLISNSSKTRGWK